MSLAFLAKVSCHEAATPSRDGVDHFHSTSGTACIIDESSTILRAQQLTKPTGLCKGIFFGVKMREIFAFWAGFISMFVNHTLLFKFFNQMIFI